MEYSQIHTLKHVHTCTYTCMYSTKLHIKRETADIHVKYTGDSFWFTSESMATTGVAETTTGVASFLSCTGTIVFYFL